MTPPSSPARSATADGQLRTAAEPEGADDEMTPERDAAADKAAQVALAMAMMTAPPVDEAEAEAAFAAMVEARAGETAMKLADGVFATPAPAAAAAVPRGWGKPAAAAAGTSPPEVSAFEQLQREQAEAVPDALLGPMAA